MSNTYTIILEFPDTDKGYELNENISYWMDECHPHIDIFGEGENQISIQKMDYRTTQSVLRFIEKNPTIKRKLLEVTEIVNPISELPKI